MIELSGPEVKVAGAYEMHVIRASGAVEKVAAFSNLVTDAGLDMLASYGINLDWCRVGSGSAEPSFSDTGLQSPLGSSASNMSSGSFSNNKAEGYNEIAKQYTFPLGGVVGAVREVIVARTSTGAAFSRALVKDGLGNPIGIDVQADEQLIVTWVARIYYPTSDFNGSFDLSVNGVDETYNYSVRAYNTGDASGYWGGAFAFGSTYTGGVLTRSSNTQISADSTGYGADKAGGLLALGGYVSGSFERTATITIPAGNSNYAKGIGGILIWTSSHGNIALAGLSAVFTPKIPKNSVRVLTLNVKVRWGRA